MAPLSRALHQERFVIPGQSTAEPPGNMDAKRGRSIMESLRLPRVSGRIAGMVTHDAPSLRHAIHMEG